MNCTRNSVTLFCFKVDGGHLRTLMIKEEQLTKCVDHTKVKWSIHFLRTFPFIVGGMLIDPPVILQTLCLVCIDFPYFHMSRFSQSESIQDSKFFVNCRPCDLLVTGPGSAPARMWPLLRRNAVKKTRWWTPYWVWCNQTCLLSQIGKLETNREVRRTARWAQGRGGSRLLRNKCCR